MITITAPVGPAPSGVPYCITVSGCATIPVVSAKLNGVDRTVRVTGKDGTYTICVDLPRGDKGRLHLRISSGNDFTTHGVSVL